MQNITLNIIGQRVLAEFFEEQKGIMKMDVLFYDDLEEFFKHYKKNDIKNIIITNYTNFDSIEQFNHKINIPIFYLSSEKNIINIDTKFQNYELIHFPINFQIFMEKVKLIYSKSQFADNSKVNISDYIINLNTKEIYNDHKKLKLTEREKDFLLYLKNSNKPQTIKKILETVWGYSKGIETHTVETHVHRLRKKFLNHFNDKNFIKNTKKGYYI